MTPIEEIKSKIDIVDFVGQTVKLRRSGKSYTGFCPFHANIKTPSFYVFPDTQSWHCFGACGTGGDVFNFVMKRENVEFGEALKMLAERAGVQLSERSPRDALEDERVRRLREITEAAARYWHNLLIKSEVARGVRNYLTNREISEQSIVNFQLGYAPESWDALSKYLLSRGYQPKDIHDAGLTSERDGGGYYDRFRNRLMFPIRDIKGQTIGFGARALDELQQPKYLNSPQSLLFDKSAVLYGVDLAKEAIRAHGVAVIVEGYADALMAHQCGFKNVVASMGTALTEMQLRTLQRLAKKFILALDADVAGLLAMQRGLDVAQRTLDRESAPVLAADLKTLEDRLKIDIRVAVLPSGYDPDDLLREDLSAWQSMLDSALPVVDYLIQIVTAPLDLSSAKGKAEAARSLVPLIQKMADPVERSHYLQDLARRLRVDERALLEANTRAPAAPTVRSRGAKPALAPASEKVAFSLEDYCLALLLRHPSELSNLERLGLQSEDFTQSENRQIFELLKSWLDYEGSEPVPDLRDALETVLFGRYEYLVAYGAQYEPINVDEIERAALRLRERVLKQQIERLRFLEEESQRANELDEMQDYRQRIALSTEQLNWTQAAISARSMAGRAQRAAATREKAV